MRPPSSAWETRANTASRSSAEGMKTKGNGSHQLQPREDADTWETSGRLHVA